MLMPAHSTWPVAPFGAGPRLVLLVRSHGVYGACDTFAGTGLFESGSLGFLLILPILYLSLRDTRNDEIEHRYRTGVNSNRMVRTCWGTVPHTSRSHLSKFTPSRSRSFLTDGDF